MVEANSQSLSDLMASVSTAAGQPGVSVVSMSWGFTEGQTVFASDEATYDRVFNVPGVTFVASTGDYGAADPEYPAYSANVVAVGGTSLTLNADSSYDSETGWGYQSASMGAFIGSGGGLSLYEPEPAYQQGVQSTGSRTTPDVSFVADPATGVWIADPYNLDPNDPFEVVGGTSVSAPAWAGLLLLVNEARADDSQPALNSTGPTETLQALYSLPQADYNVIDSGTNGFTALSDYNLVTGLGTPVANRLVSDLAAYQGPGTTYSGPTVGPLQDATLTDTGTGGGGGASVFSVFDSFTVTNNGGGFSRDLSASAAPLAGSDSVTAAGFASGSPSVFPILASGSGASLSNREVLPTAPTAVSVLTQLAMAPPTVPLVVTASTSPTATVQPGGSSVPILSAQSTGAGWASPIGQTVSPAGNRSVSSMVPVSLPRQRALRDPHIGAVESILTEWSSTHSSTAPSTVAEPTEALLAEIAKSRISEDSRTTSRPGEQGLAEDPGGLQDVGADRGARLPVWAASGLIVVGARIAFWRLKQRRQRKVEAGPAALDRAKQMSKKAK